MTTVAERIEIWKQNQTAATWYSRYHDSKYDSLVEMILDDETLSLLAMYGSDTSIAALLPPRTRQKSVFVTRKGLAAIIGEEATAKIMVWIRRQTIPNSNSDEDMEKAEIAIGRLEVLRAEGNEKSGIDLSDQLTQQLIAGLVLGGIITLEHQAALLAACTEAISISVDEVSAALLQFRINNCVGEVP